MGHFYNAKALLDRGLLEPPLHLLFVTGIHGGIGSDSANVVHMYGVAEKLFGDEYSFSVTGAGWAEFPLASLAVSVDGLVTRLAVVESGQN